MKGSDHVLIVLTFFTGLFAGGYLYITVFDPAYGERPEVINVEETDFLLAGETYGGCERAQACVSFTLEANRSYEYVPATGVDDAREPVSGKVQSEVFDELQSSVGKVDLLSLSRAGGTCISEVDGIDYRYRLIYEGSEYFLDTCGTQFGSSALAAQFADLWPLVATSSSEFGSIFGDGVGHFLEAELDKRFEYDEESAQ